ncbi:MAG: hypothetical protein PVG39_29100 [Desulfobacteraceae bacterium]|jgi:hypothetical protein
MNKRNLLKIVNVLLAILILNQVTTALIHDLLSRDTFEFLHEGGGVALFVAALVHLYLNWAWVKANILPGRKKSGK